MSGWIYAVPGDQPTSNLVAVNAGKYPARTVLGYRAGIVAARAAGASYDAGDRGTTLLDGLPYCLGKAVS